jgi:hypothetical protein
VYFKRTLSAPHDFRFLRSHMVHFAFLDVPKIAGILSERSAISGRFRRISERFAAQNRGRLHRAGESFCAVFGSG